MPGAAGIVVVDEHNEAETPDRAAPRAFISFDETVERWGAIRTSARWEKKTAECLASAGIPVFLPMMVRMTRYKTRKNVCRLPLFPGYLFFDEGKTEHLRRLAPAAQRYIAQVLRPPDYILLRTELRNIAKLLQDNRLVQAKVFGTAGETVRITHGSLKDFEGRITRKKEGSDRLVLAVSFLGLAVEVEIADSATQKVL